MGKDKKRKRDSNAEIEADQPPSKTQVIEDTPANSKEVKSEKKTGEQRQLKSERKKKKKHSVPTKQTDVSRRGIITAKSTVNSHAAQDDLASGQDFVSLSSNNKPDKKEKRRSPRAIRKEAKLKNSTNGQIKEDNSTAEGADARFICFVGNLPYSATKEQIAAHFAKLQPKSIRLSTDKSTGKSKGFAFLEFDDYDRMKTCLKLYHHSIFDPERIEDSGQQEVGSYRVPKSKGRKINVELTAGGGGGKSTDRRDKIKAKNIKLDEERARDWEKKMKEEAEKSNGPRSGRDRRQVSGANAEPATQSADASRGDIHPSRMNMVRV